MNPDKAFAIKGIVHVVLTLICTFEHSLVQAAGEINLAAAISAADDHRYPEAFQFFVRSASEGNLVAQRSSALMAFYGSTLYGDGLPGNLHAAKHWATLAASQGCAVSQYLLDQMSKHGF